MIEWLTVAEVARKFRISKNEVYDMVKSGELPAKKLGGPRKIRVSEEDAERWARGCPDYCEERE